MLLKSAVPIFYLFLFFTFSANSQINDNYEESLLKLSDATKPGVVALVSKHGEVVYSGANGTASLEFGIPLSVESVLRIGSITKQFTAAAILLLQERGKLSIKDDINKYVPNFPTEGHTVLIEHLLSHTSGIANYTESNEIMDKHVKVHASVDEMLTIMAKSPMHFAPGEGMRYSNTGYIILGKIIEVISGMTYAEFIEQEIFNKLGMHNSHFEGRKIIKNLAVGHAKSADGYQKARHINMIWPHAAGSLVSTVNDMNKWFTALTAGKLISQENYELMTAPFVLNNGKKSSYGFGLINRTVGKYAAVAHSGGIFGFTSAAHYIPEKGLYVVVLSNDENTNPETLLNFLTAEALDISLPNFEPANVSLPKLKKLMGKYRLDDGSFRTLSMDDTGVYTQRGGGPKLKVIPMSENSFYYENSLIYFVIEKNLDNRTVMNFYSGLSGIPSKAYLH